MGDKSRKVRVIELEHYYVIQDCETELCLSRFGTFDLTSDVIVRQIANAEPSQMVFDEEKDAQAVAYRRGYLLEK